LRGTFATRRSTCGFSVRRDRASGRGHRIQAAFAALRPRRVQPLKAAPRSWSGRRPGASRRRGCETTPAGAASGSTIKTPLDDALTLSRTDRIIVALGLKSRAASPRPEEIPLPLVPAPGSGFAGPSAGSSGDPELDSRLRGNERSMLHALSRTRVRGRQQRGAPAPVVLINAYNQAPRLRRSCFETCPCGRSSA